MAERDNAAVGIARLEASVSHLLGEVRGLAEDAKADHDSLSDLEHSLDTLASEVKRLQEARAAWTARAGWIIVTLAGIGSGLLGTWIQRLLGLGGP